MIIDVHGHMLDLAYRSGNRVNLHAPLGGATDIPLLQLGGVTAQLCANWTPNISLSGPHDHSVAEPLRTLLNVLDYLHRELSGPAGKDVLLAKTSADLREAAGRLRGGQSRWSILRHVSYVADQRAPQARAP